MNNSQCTAMIAKGIAIYAAYQNLHMFEQKDDTNPCVEQWKVYCCNKSQEQIDFVMKCQSNLFDHLLHNGYKGL